MQVVHIPVSGIDDFCVETCVVVTIQDTSTNVRDFVRKDKIGCLHTCSCIISYDISIYFYQEHFNFLVTTVPRLLYS